MTRPKFDHVEMDMGCSLMGSLAAMLRATAISPMHMELPEVGLEEWCQLKP